MKFDDLAALFREAAATANVRAVFGEPYQAGETAIIPVAKVSLAFGGGSGGGVGPPESGQPLGAPPPRGGGGGGGFRVTATPLGVVQVTADGVTFKPTGDPGRIALAGMALAAWNVFWISRTVRAVVQHRRERR